MDLDSRQRREAPPVEDRKGVVHGKGGQRRFRVVHERAASNNGPAVLVRGPRTDRGELAGTRGRAHHVGRHGTHHVDEAQVPVLQELDTRVHHDHKLLLAVQRAPAVERVEEAAAFRRVERAHFVHERVAAVPGLLVQRVHQQAVHVVRAIFLDDGDAHAQRRLCVCKGDRDAPRDRRSVPRCAPHAQQDRLVVRFEGRPTQVLPLVPVVLVPPRAVRPVTHGG